MGRSGVANEVAQFQRKPVLVAGPSQLCLAHTAWADVLCECLLGKAEAKRRGNDVADLMTP
jgi:hypothetical protein